MTAVINEDGTITTDDTVEYIANEVTKPTPEPQKPTNPNPTPNPQNPGDSHHVSKPSKPGTSGHSVTRPTQKPAKPSINVVLKNRTISTFANGYYVTLYSLNNGSVKKINNRALEAGSSWFSDKEVSIDGVTYFRVATNEWVRSDKVYEYQDHKSIVRTNKKLEMIPLVDAKGKTVSNRALAPDTSWRTDRSIVINNQTFYRVATNEFVSADNTLSFID